MKNVIDYFERLLSDPDEKIWVDMEIEDAKGDMAEARLTTWRSLLVSKKYTGSCFINSRQVSNGR
jgi:hypothetical protein